MLRADLCTSVTTFQPMCMWIVCVYYLDTIHLYELSFSRNDNDPISFY